ncbi:porin family protein [Chryseobacterium sp. MFBS3-17]|uniref:type IX secretion/gliding motility protein PorT/SprT n=1 Tax=Chryseobacterium sp. MFBS3-17 TaxID=2886689 RepID=UPI001D0DF1CB|nr:porin family protein [Chryseobacterium sp. MFBS3-17]MCC2589901.1 PorT family protein [Chryseobacterium sp. MFBS3-17]
MNRILLKSLVLTSLAFATFADAQFNSRNRMDKLESFDQQKFSWGFYLNGAMYDYKLVLDPRYGMDVNYNSVTSKPSYGFGAGLIGKMRLNDYFDLRMEPGLQFVQRELRFETQTNDQYAAGTLTNPPFTPRQLTEADKVRNVKSTLLDIPVMIEIHGDRWYNTRPYAAAGVNYIVNLQSNANNSDDNLQGVFRSTQNNFAWSAEMGVQIYFNRFKLTPGVRGTFFLNNEMVSDNPGTPPYWAKAISTASSRAFMFVLKFE